MTAALICFGVLCLSAIVVCVLADADDEKPDLFGKDES